MAEDIEKLVVQMSADFKAFEREMRRQTGMTTRELKKIQAEGSKAAKVTEGAFRNAALGLRGFVAGGVVAGITMSISKVGELSRQIAAVGDEARRAGVSAEAFQEWKYVAEQNRIGVDQMIDGLKELNLRADEFVVTGKGPAAEAFQRLGYTADDLKKKLADPSKLLLEIIGRLGQMDSAAQIRISDEVFGGSAGERFVELLSQGEAGIRRTIDEARNLGVIMDAELIRKADDLNRMFNSVATAVGTNLKSAIVSAAASLVDFLRLWRDFDQQTSRSLEGQINEVIRERAKLLDEQRALQSGDGLSDNARSLGFGVDSAVTQDRIGKLQERIDALNATEDRMIGVLQSRTSIPEPKAPDGTPWTPTAPSATPSASGNSGGGARERADTLDREIEAITKRTAALEAATAAQAGINPLMDEYGFASERAAAMAELLTAAQQAGVQITPELRQQLEQLAEAYGRAQEASGRLKESQGDAMQAAEDAARLRQEALGGFATDLLNGATAADALANALKRVGSRLLDIGLNSLFNGGGTGGGGGGILGAIFPGILHSGGTAGRDGYGHGRALSPALWAGAPRYHKGGIAGLKPDEVPAILQRGEIVIPKITAARAGAGTGGGRVEIILGEGLEAKILDRAAAQSVRITRDGMDKVSKQVPGIMANARLRGS